MKKAISGLLAAGIAAASLSVFPAFAADALLSSDFESGLDGWSARGTATVEISAEKASSGKQSAAVTNRSETWSGIKHELDTTVFKPGETYNFSAMVTQAASPAAVHFKLMLEYSTGGDGGFPFGGGATYAPIAEKDAASGMWTELSADYQIPADATNISLYVETQDSKIDFWIDDVYISKEGGHSGPDVPPPTTLGDIDRNGKLEKHDVELMLSFLLTKSDEVNLNSGDMNTDNRIDSQDLSILKGLILNPPVVVTEAPPVETQPPVVTQPDNPSPGGQTNAKEYMDLSEYHLLFQESRPQQERKGLGSGWILQGQEILRHVYESRYLRR